MLHFEVSSVDHSSLAITTLIGGYMGPNIHLQLNGPRQSRYINKGKIVIMSVISYSLTSQISNTKFIVCGGRPNDDSGSEKR